MPYPREIYLGDEREAELVRYIESELVQYYMDTSEHLDDLIQWQTDYWAKPTKKIAKFPFRGACTTVIPVTAIAVEAVHARTETQLFGQQQLVAAQSVSDTWDEAQKPLEDFMNYYLTRKMRIKNELASCFLEAEKFGTMIGKPGYERIVRHGAREINGEEKDFSVVHKDGPCFDSIPDARFLYPYWAKDVQSSDWIGEEHGESPYYVEQAEKAGLFREGTYEALRIYMENQMSGSPGEDGKKFERNQMDLERTKYSIGRRLEWVEFWTAWEVDKSNIKKEIVVHLHRDTKRIMSIRYNYLSDLRRPYRVGTYFPVEHRSRGIGICKMNEQFQRSITTRHRQFVDNATLANIRMFKIHKLAGYGNGEPIFPGKMWFLDNMDQIDTIQMGEVYPSAYQTEQSDVIYSQQRTGVNEVTLGMPQVGTPGTATSDLARIQEGNKKFDLWYMRVRDFGDDVVTDIADLYQQFGPRNLEYFHTAAGGEMVRAFLQLPSSYIREGIIINLKVSSQIHNKVLDRQNWQQIAGFLNQYYIGLAQLAEPLGDPRMMQLIFTKGLSAVTEAMRQILETYDVRNIDRIIVKELDMVLQGQIPNILGGNGGPLSLPSGAEPNNRIAGSGEATGMEQLLSFITGNREGGGGNGSGIS
jgi:hypothetical protein